MTNAASQQTEDQFDLSAFIGAMLDHKWLISAVTALFFSLSVAYVFIAAPVYQAAAIVQVEQKIPNLPGLAALSQVLGTSNPEAVTEIALIMSRLVIGSAVDTLHMDVIARPKRFPIFGNMIARRYEVDHTDSVAPPVLGISRYGWGGEQIKVQDLTVPDLLFNEPLTLIAHGDDTYTLEHKGTVLLSGREGESAQGNGVSLLVTKLHANAGTRFWVERDRRLSTITDLQNDVMAVEQGKDSGIIAVTYPNVDPKLAAAVLDQITAKYVRQNIERNSAEAANSLQFVRSQLPKVRNDVDKAQAALTAYQLKARSVDLSMQTKALLDQAVTIDSSIQQLHLQQAEVERQYTKNHPAYKILIEKLGQLEDQKSQLQKQVVALPDTQQELLRLNRDLEVGNTTYTNLLAQEQQLDIARAGTVGNVRIVDNAAVDVDNPIKPKKILVVAAATLVGLFLSIGAILVKLKLSKGIEDPLQIEEAGLPVYASVPMSGQLQTGRRGRQAITKKSQTLLAVQNPADLANEAIRSLRTSLHFAQLNARNNVLMIAGPTPDIGKTFVSANLAAIVAQAGQRVLLIDGDLRRGTLHSLFNAKAEAGLSDLIAGTVTMEAATRAVAELPGLSYMTRGKIAANPSELLMHPNFARVLETAKERYDLVIIDTAPILAVTDAAIIGNHAGTSLLVVRFGTTQIREVLLAKQRFNQNGVEIKGAIFNAVERRANGYYNYAYHDYEFKA
jgi:tyrosine-protein kinase Etk/Wzc